MVDKDLNLCHKSSAYCRILNLPTPTPEGKRDRYDAAASLSGRNIG